MKQEFAQGDEIGNHTFTHPEFDTISKTQFQLELNLTELLIESSLGVKTTLFRPPYGIDHQPETANEVPECSPFPRPMGYVIVGARIDPTIGERPAANLLLRCRPFSVSALRCGSEQRKHYFDARWRRRPQPHCRGSSADYRWVRAKGYEFVSVF